MKTICIGGKDADIDLILFGQRIQALVIEQQIKGLQESLKTRVELISWLESAKTEG